MKKRTKETLGVCVLSLTFLAMAAGSGSSDRSTSSPGDSSSTSNRAGTYSDDSYGFSYDLKEDDNTVTEPEKDNNDEDAAQQVEHGNYSLVSPDFKDTMDSYEAFYDTYISFMKKYSSSDGTDAFDMLQDYNDLLQKEMEWVDKIDSIDTTTLSPADSAYYFLVTARVEKKLLEASLSL